MVHTKYKCPRCGYNTGNKTNIIKHLSERKNICPGSENDIELTDDVINKVLVNRVYKIPAPVKEVIQKPAKVVAQRFMANSVNGLSSCQYVYLIREREHFLHRENIYKVGQTIMDELTMTLSRFHSYGKGSEVILLLQCNDCIALEKQILKEFNATFKKYLFRNESFVGDKRQMCAIITKIVNNEADEAELVKNKMGMVINSLKEKINNKKIKNEKELPNKSELFYNDNIMDIINNTKN
jgi:hypothetical protein